MEGHYRTTAPAFFGCVVALPSTASLGGGEGLSCACACMADPRAEPRAESRHQRRKGAPGVGLGTEPRRQAHSAGQRHSSRGRNRAQRDATRRRQHGASHRDSRWAGGRIHTPAQREPAHAAAERHH